MPSLPPHGASLASGQGIAAALEPCAKCGQSEQSLNHVRCIYREHDGVCPAPERHHAYVPAQEKPPVPPSDEERLARFREECAALPATRPPDATCEECGGPAWKPLLCCAACYPKRLARAMLRRRAEEAEQWNHADGCMAHFYGKHNCNCGLFAYREEAKAAAEQERVP